MWESFLEVDQSDLIQRLAHLGLDKDYDLETLTLDELVYLAKEKGIL